MGTSGKPIQPMALVNSTPVQGPSKNYFYNNNINIRIFVYNFQQIFKLLELPEPSVLLLRQESEIHNSTI